MNKTISNLTLYSEEIKSDDFTSQKYKDQKGEM